MKHVEGWSYYEMSETLDASVSALKMRVHRAREELQVLLQSYGS
jgi:DNA-directed RNA polymerase specialized sigma24 family protein